MGKLERLYETIHVNYNKKPRSFRFKEKDINKKCKKKKKHAH